MINKIIRFSLDNRLLVLGIAIFMCAYGVYTASQLPIDVLPNLNRPVVSIFSEGPGLASEEIETQITFPIESVVNGSPGVQRVRSASVSGLSIVWVDFDWGENPFHARQIITEKLQQIRDTLPPGVNPTMGPITSIMGEVMLLGLTSAEGEVSPMELRTIADWTLRPRLLALGGVSQVSVIGGEVKQYHILADPQGLVRNGVTLNELEVAVRESNENFSGGYLIGGAREKPVRTLGRFTNIEQIRRVPVKHDEGHAGRAYSLQIDHIADVKLGGPLAKRGDASVNAVPAVILTIQKQPRADTLDLTRAIEKELVSLQHSLPEGVELHDDIFRQSRFIKSATVNVKEVLRDGAILVTIVLFLFLLNVKTTVITLTAIPLSLLISVITFKLLGLSINTMTLGGLAIAIGELVDDAIVDVENIFRRLRENRQKTQPEPVIKVVYDASCEIRASIVNATLIVILVFLPLFVLGGIEGRLFMPIGIAYVTSILASLLVALTVTPVLAVYLLPNSLQMSHTADSSIVSALKRMQRWCLERILQFKWWALSVTATLFIIAICLGSTFGKEFLPPFNEGAFTINMAMAPGTSLQESNRIGVIAEKLLLEIPEISKTGRRAGRGELDEHAQGVHSSEIDVEFDVSGRSKDVIVREIREKLSHIPGVVINVGQPISHRIDHLLSGVRAQIAMKIFGPDLHTLASLAGQIEDIAATIPGMTDIFVEKQTLVPQMHVRIARERALQYGLSMQEIGEFVETALNGRTVSRIVQGQQTFDIVLRIKDGVKQSIKELSELPILVESGGYVPLGQVADLEEASGPNVISRDNASRRIYVAANVAGADLVTTVEKLQQAIAEQVKLPEGYFISYAGQFESQARASRLIYILGFVSLLLISGVLFSHFRSVSLTLQIMLAIPFAFIGAMFGVYLTGGVLSIASLVGLITLTGIASRNGIMMIDHYLHLMHEEGEGFSLEMLYRGSAERLVPVLMTALTAILALTPILLGGGDPGKEILYPVAVVIFSGLFSSTSLNLLITPLVFWMTGERAIAERNRFSERS